MKATAFSSGWVVALWALFAAACTPASELSFDGEPQQLHSIPYLKSRCTGASVTLREQIAIRGIVTANDGYGEFDREITIEDAEGGISIAIDHSDLASLYPLGHEVTVTCNSLTLCDYGGVISLGTSPTEYGAGRIPANETSRFLRAAPTATDQLPPHTLRVTEVAARDIDTYVRFTDVEFTHSGTWCDTDPETGRPVTTEHTVIDAQGNLFTVRVHFTCHYAKEHLPKGKCSICGIIDCFNGRYAIRITGHKIFPA